MKELNSAILLTELFNRYHMNIYHVGNSGFRTNLHEYEEGSYFEEYYLQDGVITKRKIYGKRHRNIEQEESYRISLLMDSRKDVKYVLHNHVEPMSKQIKDHLLAEGDNTFIYRKDRRAQLGSYAIAMNTKQFAKFNDSAEDGTVFEEIPQESVIGLLKRIKVWDLMDKRGPVIAYEDIQFQSSSGWPQKQVLDYRARLSSKIVEWIDEQVTRYEDDKQFIQN